MKNRGLFAILILTTFVALPLVADAGSDAAAIYKSKCAMCHGADGKGQTPTGKVMKVRDLSSAEVQKMTDKEIATVIADGKGKMPPSKGKLSQAAIDAMGVSSQFQEIVAGQKTENPAEAKVPQERAWREQLRFVIDGSFRERADLAEKNAMVFPGRADAEIPSEDNRDLGMQLLQEARQQRVPP